MAVKVTFHDELKQLKQYLLSDSNEDAKRPLLYPIFKKLFKEKFRIESDAYGADGYVEGKIILESKTDYSDWLEGFYQALHYQKRYGLVYSMMVVIAQKFVGIWRVNQIPEHAFLMAHAADPLKAPNLVGRENARKTPTTSKREIQAAAVYWLEPKDLQGNFFEGEGKSITVELHEILNLLRNTDAERLQVNTHNFIDQIELLKKYFDHPIDAVHAFYTMVAYWDVTSLVSTNDHSPDVQIVGFKGKKHSEAIFVKPVQLSNFQKFVESRYIFTNEGSGLTVDYYFGRFDEVMARIDPEYVKQHGIFFTDVNLSKFALWFAKRILGDQLNDQYIFFDPAGGSGNLISSWRGRQKHKIISELQPDLLRIIERRMRIDPWHVETGFTIIPKTSENKGLNFLDCDAPSYVAELEKELKLKNLALDKPFAFLLNPPYKNTDEHESVRENADANYSIHPSVLEITGDDAGKERYLAFLGQILNIARHQNSSNPGCDPVVMIFTPTSWLIPRPTYVPFRNEWDKYFEYLDGFIITSNEFFKLKGKWPLAFTVWKFRHDETGANGVKVYDFTAMKNQQLKVNWALGDAELEFVLGIEFNNCNNVNLSESRLPFKDWVNQSMFDFKRDPTKAEINSKDIFGGLPLNDSRRKNKKTYGNSYGEFIGFMDDNTPVRLIQDGLLRFSKVPDRVWLQLRPTFIDINLTKIHSGPTDKYGYCAENLSNAKNLFSWFCITKALIQKYPTWANQLDIWAPEIPAALADYLYALCFSFVLAENRCVVTLFEADNPVPGAPEIFADNPLCPANPESFWATTLDSQVTPQHGVAYELVTAIKALYRTWNLNYCHGQFLRHVGLKEEAYFRHFSYPDFLTPHSGLIQIRKYAELHNHTDLMEQFTKINGLTKQTRDEIYQLLVDEMRYFG
jgi:hypothetical protein